MRLMWTRVASGMRAESLKRVRFAIRGRTETDSGGVELGDYSRGRKQNSRRTCTLLNCSFARVCAPTPTGHDLGPDRLQSGASIGRRRIRTGATTKGTLAWPSVLPSSTFCVRDQ